MQRAHRTVDFKTLLKQWVIVALGVGLASVLSEGIRFDSFASLLLAVFFISLLNVFIKPLLMLAGLPFIVMTLGLGILLINAVIFSFAGYLVPGFHVLGLGSAFWGALIVSLTTLMVNIFLVRPKIVVTHRSKKGLKPMGGAKEYRGKLDDVIDV